MSQPRDPGRYYPQGQPQRNGPPGGNPSGGGYQPGGGYSSGGGYPSGGRPGGYPPGAQPPARGQQPGRVPPPARGPARPPARSPQPARRLRIPGVSLLLTLAGTIIQVLCLFVLPWVTAGSKDKLSLSMPDLRSATIDFGTHGFGAWYLVLFTYPLAALGLVLALAAILDSVALKVVWACLALAGAGVLVVSYGVWPLFASVAGDHGGFTGQKVTALAIGLAVAGVVIFILKSALSMFRRVAGLILIVMAGVHVAALVDLVKGHGLSDLSFAAYGPALAYVLTAVAAVIAPRRLPGV